MIPPPTNKIINSGLFSVLNDHLEKGLKGLIYSLELLDDNVRTTFKISQTNNIAVLSWKANKLSNNPISGKDGGI